MHARTSAFLIAALISTTAQAQASGGGAPAKPAQAQAQEPTPKLPAEGKRWVEGFRGNWTGRAKLTAGERELSGTMRMTCVKSSAGWATICKGSFTAPGARPEEDTYLMGWDVGTKQAHMYEVTSAADVHDHVGAWSDDRSITVTHHGKTADGQDEEAAITFKWISAKQLDAEGAGKVAGKSAWTMSATFKK